MKSKIDQLINHMLGDCIHSENPTDLYNALVRLEKGSVALLNIARIHELEHYIPDTGHEV
jgi:hypothetical protein